MAKGTHWSNRIEFIMAAVGSAIGLGNIWRFPYICYKNGGGAFLIPFLVALFVAGIPLLIMKFAIGQSTGYGAPKALGSLNRNWKWLGWMAILVGFGIASYYAVVMGWSFNYLYHSLNMAWGDDPESFFMKRVLQYTGLDGEGAFSIVPHILIGLVLTWIAIYFSIWKGVKTVGKVVWITVPLPALILVIIIIRGITLPGAAEGLAAYLTPDLDALKNPSVWLDAFGQVFYSLSLGFGIMIAYAAYNPKDSDVNNSAFTTGLWDSFFAYLCGFAVFSVLGFLAVSLDKTVADVASSGPGLAFVVFPTILSKLPFLNVVFSVLFFLMLLTLGIDSAFSLVEAIAKAFGDYFPRVRTEVMALFCCIAMFLAGLVFSTKAGLNVLDITDHYFNMGLVIVCLMECVLVGWLVGPAKLREYANSVSDFRIGAWWDAAIRFAVPAMLFYLVASTVVKDLTEGYGGYPLKWRLIAGWIPLVMTFVVGLVLGAHWRLLTGVILFSLLSACVYYFLDLGAGAETVLIFSSSVFLLGIFLTTRTMLRRGRKEAG